MLNLLKLAIGQVKKTVSKDEYGFINKRISQLLPPNQTSLIMEGA